MNYETNGNIVTLTFDDGKANVVGHAFMDALDAALDRAEHDAAGAVILRGREGMFSAGFDLKEFEKGVADGVAMVQRGFKLLVRLYSFPRPLVAACTGHGVAMGAFLIMTCDYRIGTRGAFKITLPETAIGMDLPPVLMELTASRISKQHLSRVAIMSEVYSPDQSIEAGFLDETVDAGELAERSLAVAQKLAQLPQQQYAKNKLAARSATLTVMRDNLTEMTGA